MSLVDLLSSTGWFLSTWATPEGSILYAKGNQASCNFQGFLLQMAIGGPLYNGALILYYLLIIKYNWSNEKLVKLEPWVHLFIWSWCIGTSITLILLDRIHSIGVVCWIDDPPECYEEISDPDVSCYAGYIGLALFCIPLWICILTSVWALLSIYMAVKKTHLRLKRFSLNGSTEINST
jgi:hypothetical protein